MKDHVVIIFNASPSAHVTLQVIGPLTRNDALRLVLNIEHAFPCFMTPLQKEFTP